MKVPAINYNIMTTSHFVTPVSKFIISDAQ